MGKLVFTLGETERVDFDLSADVVTLGRSDENDIVINNSWISGRHARFERRRGSRAVVVIDLDSSNGITVNGERIAEKELRHGDSVMFGQLEARYEAPLPPPSRPGVPQLVPTPAVGLRLPRPFPTPEVRPSNDLAKTQMIPLPKPADGELAADEADESILAARHAMLRRQSEAVEAAESRLFALEVQISAGEAALNGLLEKKATAEASTRTLAGEIEAARAERTAAIDAAARARAATREEEAKLAEVQATLAGLERERAEKDDALSALATRLADEQARAASMKDLSEEYYSLHQRVVKLRMDDAALAGASAALAGLVAKQNATQMGIEQRERRIAEMEARLAKLESDIATAQTAREEAETMRARAAEEAQAMALRRTTVRDDLAAAEAILAQVAAQADEGKAALARWTAARDGVAALEARKAALGQEIDALTEDRRLLAEAITPEWGTVHVFARGVIRRLELIEDLMDARADDPVATAQLGSLRDSCVELLADHGVTPYSIEVGTVLDVAARKRIQIVEPGKEPGEVTEVAEVYRRGFVCDNGGEAPPTLLRKVEVRTCRR